MTAMCVVVFFSLGTHDRLPGGSMPMKCEFADDIVRSGELNDAYRYAIVMPAPPAPRQAKVRIGIL